MYEQTLDFGAVWAGFDRLVAGAGLTLALTAQAIALGMVIAVGGAWIRTGGPRWARRIVAGYVEVIRNTPFLLQFGGGILAPAALNRMTRRLLQVPAGNLPVF